jgi:hypothetical protein
VLAKGAKTFRIQIGHKAEIISVDDLKPHTFALPPWIQRRLPVSAVPANSQPPLRVNSTACNFMKMQTGGRGHVEEQFVLIIFVHYIHASQIWHQ